METCRVIEGRVLDVHVIGTIGETVTVCHFDPRYVVSVQTAEGVRKLAIHSPARTFEGANPVGRDFRFHLAKSGDHFLLEKAQEMKAQSKPGHAPDPPGTAPQSTGGRSGGRP